MESKETEEFWKELTHWARHDTRVWKLLETAQGPTEGTEEITSKNYETLATRHLDFQTKFLLIWCQILQTKASELQHDKEAGVLKTFLSNFNMYNFMEINQ
jgi:hypothetical protein